MHCLPVADDCGVSSSVTEIILRCIDTGSLRGASVIASGVCALEAAYALGQRLYKQPDLAVGVHLNLLEGHCTAPAAEIPLLVDAQGWFRYGLASLWAALTLSRGSKKEALLHQMLVECRAQIDWVHHALGKGWLAAWSAEHTEGGEAPACPPCYLDGHLHIHCIPAFRPVLGALLDSYHFSHVRVPSELRRWMPAPLSRQLVGGMRRELLYLWSQSLRTFLKERGVKAPDYFVGSFASGGMTLSLLRKSLAAISEQAPGQEALVEIMFHPSPPHDLALSDSEQSLIPPGGEQLFDPFATCPPSMNTSIAVRQSRLEAVHGAANRRAEGALLLSKEYKEALGLYDTSWRREAKL